MGASTIVVAREDLSIPGAADAGSNGAADSAADIEARFFNVVRQFNPDVVVLDLTGSPSMERQQFLRSAAEPACRSWSYASLTIH